MVNTLVTKIYFMWAVIQS